jgi:hypothetical protein
MPDNPMTPEEFIQAVMEHPDRDGQLDRGHMTAVLRIVAAYTESIRREGHDNELAATRAAVLEQAADALTQKHHADFAIGVCRAREIILNCITQPDADALAEVKRVARLEEAKWWEHLAPECTTFKKSDCLYCQRLTELRALPIDTPPAAERAVPAEEKPNDR